MCFLLTSMVQCWSNYSSPFLVLCFKSRIQRDSCKSAIKRSKYWSYANTGSFSKSSEPREKKNQLPLSIILLGFFRDPGMFISWIIITPIAQVEWFIPTHHFLTLVRYQMAATVREYTVLSSQLEFGNFLGSHLPTAVLEIPTLQFQH